MLPFRSLWHVLTLSLCPKMLLSVRKCVSHILMHVKSNTNLWCNYNNKFLFLLTCQRVLFYAVVYVLSLIEREVQSFYLKNIFAKIIHAFSEFLFFFFWLVLFFLNEKWHIAFIVHDAWRLRLSSGKRIMFNFCWSTLQTK